MEYLKHGYKISTDYEKLFELIKTQRVVCFTPYHNDSKTADVCQSQSVAFTNSIDIGARGISYISALAISGRTLKEDFIKQCEESEIEYIEPNNLECSWRLNESDGSFNGSCGIKWELSNDGTLEENHMNFCPQCGKKMVEVKAKQIEAIGYYMLVSNLWQKTTKKAYDMSRMLKKVRINMEYFDESWELLHSDMNTDEAIQEVEEYLEELSL